MGDRNQAVHGSLLTYLALRLFVTHFLRPVQALDIQHLKEPRGQGRRDQNHNVHLRHGPAPDEEQDSVNYPKIL